LPALLLATQYYCGLGLRPWPQGDDAAVQQQVEKERSAFDGFELKERNSLFWASRYWVQVANRRQPGHACGGFDPWLTVERAWQLSPFRSWRGERRDLVAERM